MTFKERYDIETTWSGKVMIMEIFHLAQSVDNKNWKLAYTAYAFDCSIGLVSENLKLAEAIHKNGEILLCQSRQEALKVLRQ